MVGSNLPPGTTPGDIDKHFGEPDTQQIVGKAIISVEMNEDAPPDEVLNISGSVVEEEVVHTETVEEVDDKIIKTVHIGVEFDSQFDSPREWVKTVKKGINIEPTSDIVIITQYVDTEF